MVERHSGKTEKKSKGRNTKSEKGHHPATFPEKLAHDCILMHGYTPDTIVLDPFAGTGTTLLAAKKLGTKYIGIDIDKSYIEYAMGRLEK